jgi:hypothetical protein
MPEKNTPPHITLSARPRACRPARSRRQPFPARDRFHRGLLVSPQPESTVSAVGSDDQRTGFQQTRQLLRGLRIQGDRYFALGHMPLLLWKLETCFYARDFIRRLGHIAAPAKPQRRKRSPSKRSEYRFVPLALSVQNCSLPEKSAMTAWVLLEIQSHSLRSISEFSGNPADERP